MSIHSAMTFSRTSFLHGCRVCRNLADLGPIRRSHVASGHRNGCELCSVLYKGLALFEENLSEEMQQIFCQLDMLCPLKVFDRHKHDGIESVFAFELHRQSPAKDVRDFDVPFEVFLDSKHMTQDVPLHLEMSKLIKIINKWNSGCDLYHPRCQINAQSPLPRRVLDIKGKGDDHVRLFETNGECAAYVALSYCWGSSGNRITTTTTSISSHRNRISWNALPKTFQDAIQICRELNIRYLWIDALCILQDDLAEWEIESSKMSTVYSNARLTIAASSCADSTQSLFKDRWTSTPVQADASFRSRVDTVQVQQMGRTLGLRPKLHLAHDRFINLENSHSHSADAPLLTRAWVFQERLLSQRTLHFHAEELVWECKTGLRCECGELDDVQLKKAEGEEYTAPWPLPATRSDRWLKSFFASIEDRNTPADKTIMVWLDLVSEFTRLDLTYESDRLPALSGLAAKFASTPMGAYVAGLWSKYISLCLLYESISNEEAREDDLVRKAPSWSWASLPLHGSNAISYHWVLRHQFLQCPAFKALNIQGTIPWKNPYGWVDDATLRVRGKCVDGVVMINKSVEKKHDYLSDGKRIWCLFADRPASINQDERLLYLHLGSTLGLALRKVNDQQHYQRVGLVKLSIEPDWLASECVRTLCII